MKRKPFIVADLFCGAGSLSAGIEDALSALGYAPRFVAVNHWDIATQTYALNHPNSAVHCCTLDAAFPYELVPGGRLDLLAAGIECTFFSRARGGKPVNDQQRMSAWHVVRWATELDIKRLLLENVPEFLKWGPVDPATGRPIKAREGEYFRAFRDSLAAIGFTNFDYQVINCADHGDATTRQRLFMLADRTRKRVAWPKAAFGKIANGVPVWRGADEIIDWSLKGTSIFTRKKPLAPKTLARIAAGMVKFNWPEPFLVVLRRHADARGIALPLPALTAGGTHIGLVEPFIATVAHGNSKHERDPNSRRCKGLKDPLQTIHAGGGKVALVEPFVLPQGGGGTARSTRKPMATATTDGAHALIAPYYGSGSGLTCRSTKKPLPAATAKARFALIAPVKTHGSGSDRARALSEPLPTITTSKRGELAFITASFGERKGQKPRVHAGKKPVPAICAKGRINLVEPGLKAVHGRRPEEGVDILFRMLEPHELAAAMSISTPEKPYRFAGNKTQVVKQIGQAVPRRTAAALARALIGGKP